MTHQRLTGSWLLMSFTPREPLEPMLAGLLAAQFGSLVVDFDGRELRATGIGISATRRYEITHAEASRFSLRSYDDKGLAYDAVGEFRTNDEVWFDSRTVPWHGTGVLRRR
jgi:hypothetical protein